MKCWVSGSHGFVGRHFVKRLLDNGHEVHGIDNLSSGLEPQQWAFKPKSLLNAYYDYSDVRQWMKEFSADDFDLIIHCAAVVGGRAKIDGDPLAVATNLSIDAEFFNWVVRAKNKPKIIYFSSSAVYPVELQQRDKHCQLSEDFVLPQWQTKIGMPDSTYGWSKLSGEVLAHYAVRDYDADVVIYRPFGGYGEDQSFDYPMPSIIRRVVNNESPIVVWGSGEQLRDFIHISDVVDAVLSTMHKLNPGDALNIGTGMGQSFKQIANIACGILNRNTKIINDVSKPEGVFARVADPAKLSQMWNVPDPMRRLVKGIESMIKVLQK